MSTDLRALAEAATPGPWHVDGPEFGGMWVVTGAPMPRDSFAVHPHSREQEHAVIAGQGEDDAAYIAAASPDRILALLDVVDAARAVMHEWTVLGPTGTEDTVTAHARLRAALVALEGER